MSDTETAFKALLSKATDLSQEPIGKVAKMAQPGSLRTMACRTIFATKLLQFALSGDEAHRAVFSIATLGDLDTLISTAKIQTFELPSSSLCFSVEIVRSWLNDTRAAILAAA